MDLAEACTERGAKEKCGGKIKRAAASSAETSASVTLMSMGALAFESNITATLLLPRGLEKTCDVVL